MAHVLDYLVNLRDLNHTVAFAGQALRDQVKAQLPDDIFNMMYMLGPNLVDDDAFTQVVEIVGKRIEEITRNPKVCNSVKRNPRKTRQKKKKL
jgi:hypothetical protein